MVSARAYTVVFEAVAITAVQDLFEITPADDKPVRIAAMMLIQTTDLGDAQEEVLRWQVIRGHTTGGSGGTAPTPRPVRRTDPSAGFTAEVNNTTQASAGTTHTVHSDGFNVRQGERMFWTPETMIDATQADTTLVVRLAAAPADSITVSGVLYVVEEG